MASPRAPSPLARKSALAVVALSLGALALPWAGGGCYPAKDCEVACRNVLACRGIYDDADLAATTEVDCLAACNADEQLNYCFDDCDPAEVRVKWQCATGQADCSSLDHTCDVY